MLNVYLVPKRHSLYHPPLHILHRWLRDLHRTGLSQGYLADPLLSKTESVESVDLPIPYTIDLAPGLNVSHLFNQEAHESLLPAELTFESMIISSATHPTLLPLEDLDYQVSCPCCGDSLPIEDVHLAMTKLDLFPLSSIGVFCLSCQDEQSLKSLTFEPLTTFARFWISLKQCGSTRLNQRVLKGWERLLNCELEQINVQLDHCIQQDDSAWFIPSSSQLNELDPTLARHQYRSQKWAKKRSTKKSKYKGKGKKRWSEN